MKRLNKKIKEIYWKRKHEEIGWKEDGIDTHGMPPIENGMTWWERDPPVIHGSHAIHEERSAWIQRVEPLNTPCNIRIPRAGPTLNKEACVVLPFP